MRGSVKTVSMLVAGVIAMSAGPSAPAVAQTPEPAGPSWFRMNVLHVRADRMDQMKEVQKRITAAVKAQGTSAFRAVWETGQYGESYTLYVFQPIEKFSAFDTPDQGVLSDEDAAKFRDAIVRRESYALVFRPDLSAANATRRALAVVERVGVVPGREADYAKLHAAEVVPAWEKAGLKDHGTGEIVFGGETGFYHWVFIDNYAEIDKGSPMIRALGPEGAAALRRKLAGLANGSERAILRYLPELSFEAPPQSSSAR